VTVSRPVVAIVDDDPGTVRAIARMVELAGYVPVVFTSAESMLESAPAVVDCVIADVHLPGIDGIELAGRLEDSVPVILVSASEEAESRVRAMPGPPRVFLPKPFPAQSLLETLSRMIGAEGGEAAARRRYS